MSTGEVSTGEAQATPGSLGHVLVAEDKHVNQLVAVGMLAHLGYTTWTHRLVDPGYSERRLGR